MRRSGSSARRAGFGCCRLVARSPSASWCRSASSGGRRACRAMTCGRNILWVAFAAFFVRLADYDTLRQPCDPNLRARARKLLLPSALVYARAPSSTLCSARAALGRGHRPGDPHRRRWLADPTCRASGLFYLTLFRRSRAQSRARRLQEPRVVAQARLDASGNFARVEAAYWRYNAYPLGVLLLLFIGFGAYRELSTPVLALGVPLLVLAAW